MLAGAVTRYITTEPTATKTVVVHSRRAVSPVPTTQKPPEPGTFRSYPNRLGHLAPSLVSLPFKPPQVDARHRQTRMV